MKLYHYEHCPFCQRVRLFLGFKGISYEKILLSYDDEKTPKSLIGKHQSPILEMDNGKIFAESLDIIREIEMQNPYPIGFVGPVEGTLQWASMAVCGLPRYFDMLLPVLFDHYTKEFVEIFPAGGNFFRESKEQKRGKSFEILKEETPEIFESTVLPTLLDIVEKVEDQFFLMGPTFSVADCVLAADLSALRLVPNISLPPEIVAYIERVENRCGVFLLKNEGK